MYLSLSLSFSSSLRVSRSHPLLAFLVRVSRSDKQTATTKSKVDTISIQLESHRFQLLDDEEQDNDWSEGDDSDGVRWSRVVESRDNDCFYFR